MMIFQHNLVLEVALAVLKVARRSHPHVSTVPAPSIPLTKLVEKLHK